MLPTSIDLDQAAERREAEVAERLARHSHEPKVRSLRRAIGRWFMATGARLAGEPGLSLARSRRT